MQFRITPYIVVGVYIGHQIYPRSIFELNFRKIIRILMNLVSVSKKTNSVLRENYDYFVLSIGFFFLFEMSKFGCGLCGGAALSSANTVSQPLKGKQMLALGDMLFKLWFLKDIGLWLQLWLDFRFTWGLGLGLGFVAYPITNARTHM